MKAGATTWKSWRADVAGLCMVGAISVVGYLGAVQPALRSNEQQDLQQRDLAAQNEKAAQVTTSINVLKRQLVKLEQAAAESPLQLQSAQLSNQRLAELTRLASDNGLQVDGVRTGTISTGPHFELVPIHLSGRGAFKTSTAFLARLHEQFADMGLTAMMLTDNPGNPQWPTSLQLELVWYAAPAVTSAGN